MFYGRVWINDVVNSGLQPFSILSGKQAVDHCLQTSQHHFLASRKAPKIR